MWNLKDGKLKYECNMLNIRRLCKCAENRVFAANDASVSNKCVDLGIACWLNSVPFCGAQRYWRFGY